MKRNYPDDLNLYKICREYLVHEDTLINIRLNWLLAIQTFLFAAYGLSEKEIYGSSEISELKPFIHVLQVIGIATSILIFLAILSAVLAIKKLEKHCINHIKNDKFPLLTGGGKHQSPIDKIQNLFQVALVVPCLISIGFSAVWIYLSCQSQ